MRRVKRLLQGGTLGLILGALLLSACLGRSTIYDQASRSLLSGITVDDLKKRACNSPEYPCHDWAKPDYVRENGNPVYREITLPGCWIHREVDWKADPRGRIVGWRVEGDYCDGLIPKGQRFSLWYGPHGPESVPPSTK